MVNERLCGTGGSLDADVDECVLGNVPERWASCEHAGARTLDAPDEAFEFEVGSNDCAGPTDARPESAVRGGFRNSMAQAAVGGALVGLGVDGLRPSVRWFEVVVPVFHYSVWSIEGFGRARPSRWSADWSPSIGCAPWRASALGSASSRQVSVIASGGFGWVVTHNLCMVIRWVGRYSIVRSSQNR